MWIDKREMNESKGGRKTAVKICVTRNQTGSWFLWPHVIIE